MKKHLNATDMGALAQLEGDLLRVDAELAGPPATRVRGLHVQLLGGGVTTLYHLHCQVQLSFT